MAENILIRKINSQIDKGIHDECQAVFILSRIRKLIELNNEWSTYKYLNFYCNWALHAKIDKTEHVADILTNFIDSSDDNKFTYFGHFFEDLNKFVIAKGLSIKIIDNDNYIRLLNFMVDIYSEVPVEVESNNKKWRIVIGKPREPISGVEFEVSYSITAI